MSDDRLKLRWNVRSMRPPPLECLEVEGMLPRAKREAA